MVVPVEVVLEPMRLEMMGGAGAVTVIVTGVLITEPDAFVAVRV